MRTLYVGGEVVTLEAGGIQEALLVEDGRIVSHGDRAHLLAYQSPDTRLVDLRGHALLPGFIDAHSHLTDFAATLGLAQLAGVKSHAQLLERLRSFIASAPPAPGQWVNGFGYDHNDLEEATHPTRALLDHLAVDAPVLVTHASGHMGVANTKALQAMGITPDTPDPEGGRIGREADGRTPNGYLEETAFTRAAAAVAQPGLDQLAAQLEHAQRVYLENGVTTVQDGFTKLPNWTLLRQLALSGRLTADVVCYLDIDGAGQLASDYREYVGVYRDHLKIGGYKAFLDGSPQGRTAWMSAPYEGAEDGYRGYPVHEDEAVQGFFERALREDMQLLLHANGDAAAQQMIDCYARARQSLEDAPDIRPVMIHAQLVRPDQLAAMAQLRITASFFVAHTYHWGDVHLKNFGPERGALISPARSALAAGVNYTFHQDCPVLPPDMLDTLACAVQRVTREGVPLAASERLSAEQALRGVTANAAYQYFEEDGKGTLAPGKRADLVVLEKNPLRQPPEALRDNRVLETIKDGETVYIR